MGPVRPAERIEVVDVLRGLAIFGMFVVNMSHDLPWAYMFVDNSPGAPVLPEVLVLETLGKGKFFALFAFFFGFGHPRGSRDGKGCGVHACRLTKNARIAGDRNRVFAVRTVGNLNWLCSDGFRFNHDPAIPLSTGFIARGNGMFCAVSSLYRSRLFNLSPCPG